MQVHISPCLGYFVLFWFLLIEVKFIHNKMHSSYMLISMFENFIYLYNHHPNKIENIFIIPESPPCFSPVKPSFPEETTFWFLTPWFSVFCSWISYKWNRKVSGGKGLLTIAQHKVLETHFVLCVSVSGPLFYCWVMFLIHNYLHILLLIEIWVVFSSWQIWMRLL